MKIIKRSQMLVLSLTLMIMVAGYINYKYDETREENLGKTVYVNNSESVEVYTESQSKNTKLYDSKLENTMSEFKDSRDSYFSELQSVYSSAIQNDLLTSEQIKEYQEKIDELINKKYILSSIENVIKTKDIEDIVLIPSDETIHVVVLVKDTLSNEKVATIEKIIIDELKIDAKNITISEIINNK